MAIIGAEINSKKFSWAANTGSTFFTDLGSKKLFGRLYDDAADVGFVIVSEKTNKRVPFSYAHDILSKEGELQGWLFKGVIGKSVINVAVYND